MENPRVDIGGVIRDLTMGTMEEQRNAINTYFNEDAAFVHPFVWVPGFAVSLPLVGNVNSRMIILAIYKWYRFMSPDIQLKIESSTYDIANDIAYVKIYQRFAIWFIPLHVSFVHLVTVLKLQPYQIPQGGPGADHDTPKKLIRYKIASQEDLYQTTEWIKFVLPWVGAPVFCVWQLINSALCVLMAVTYALVAFILSPPQWRTAMQRTRESIASSA